MRLIVFTDLDGTLLDHHSYSWAAAQPALQALRDREIPLVIVTSKTRFEVEALRRALDNRAPYVVENGAAVFWEGGRHVLGSRREEAIAALRQSAEECDARVRGFELMTLEEIVQRTGLPEEIAELAAQREFGEPFVMLDGQPGRLAGALERRGFRMKQGGRFFHVSGPWDKATAVRWLLEQNRPDRSLALGDAPNDAAMLTATDDAVIVRGKHVDQMLALLPGTRVTEQEGPAGWNASVLEWLREHSTHQD